MTLARRIACGSTAILALTLPGLAAGGDKTDGRDVGAKLGQRHGTDRPSHGQRMRAFGELGAGRGYRAKVLRVGAGCDKDPLTIVHLHGRGKRTDNAFFRRLVGALEAGKGLACEIVGVPWQDDALWALKKAIRQAPKKSIVLSGHSLGGERVHALAREFPEQVRGVVLFNPSVAGNEMPLPVPALVVRGEHDSAEPRVILRENLAIRAEKSNITWLQVPGADHSLRHVPAELVEKLDRATRKQLTTSEATQELTRAVGEVVAAFVQDRQLPRVIRDPKQIEPVPKKRRAAAKEPDKAAVAAADSLISALTDKVEGAEVVRFGEKTGKPLTMLYLEGGGLLAAENDKLFQRLEGWMTILEAASRTYSEGEKTRANKGSIDFRLVRLPGKGLPEKELAELLQRAEDQSLVLAGHRAGATMAKDLAKKAPDKVRGIVAINPNFTADTLPGDLRALAIRGEASHPYFVRREAMTVLDHGGEADKLTYFPVRDADEDLRYRPADAPARLDRDALRALANDDRTRNLNREVARVLLAFVTDQPLPPAVAKAHNRLGSPEPKRTPAPKKAKPKLVSSTPVTPLVKRTPPRPKRFEELGSGEKKAVTVELGGKKGDAGLTIVHLPSMGKLPDNPVFRRLVDGLKQTDLAGRVVSVNWDGWSARDDMEAAIAAAKDNSVVLAGFSGSGYRMYALAREFPKKVRAVVALNPKLKADERTPVRTLFVRSEHDSHVTRDGEFRKLAKGKDFGDKVVYFPLRGADHSFRSRPRNDKATGAVGRELGQAVAAFVSGEDRPAAVRRALQLFRGSLARELFAKIRRLPRAVRRRAVQTLEANQALLEQIAADGAFGWKAEQVGIEHVIRRRQKADGKKALKKVLKEWGDVPAAHPIDRKPERLEIPSNSGRKVEVYRMSQPTPATLKKLVKRAGKEGIRPHQIAVINLRLENNGEAKWPKMHGKLKGLKMKHLGYLDHSVPPLDLVKQVLEVISDPKLKMVVLHCYAGRARTGTMAAAMRIVLDGWTVDRALKEAKELGMQRPIQQYFIRWFGRLVKKGTFKL